MAKQVQLEIGDEVYVYGESYGSYSNGLVLYLTGIYMGNGFIYIHERVDVKDPSLYIHNINNTKYWKYIVPVDMLIINTYPTKIASVNGSYVDSIFKHGLTWDNFKKEVIQDADTPTNCKLKDYDWFKKIQKIIAEKFA